MDPGTITAYAACIAALAAVIGAVRSFFNAARIQDIHLSINSRLDQLVAKTSALSHSEGKAEGRSEMLSEMPHPGARGEG